MELGVHLTPKESNNSLGFGFDFDFYRGQASPMLSTPSSPARFGGGLFFSTPPTPDRQELPFGAIRSPHQQKQSPARETSQPKNSKSNIWSPITTSPKTNKQPSKLPALENATERSGREAQRVSSRSREARSLSPERRKWRLKDLLLFRSKSEGHSHKDPLKKYSKISSISIDQQQSSYGKRGSMVSAHELHYKTNRAISDDLKKKSFLPYKQGILGRLAVNPTVHALAHGFGSFAPYRG